MLIVYISTMYAGLSSHAEYITVDPLSQCHPCFECFTGILCCIFFSGHPMFTSGRLPWGMYLYEKLVTQTVWVGFISS
ncbi:hypothetical protein EUGRSUZ_C01166 [Eucalyptus grandis]|uniref:Uncharacterized protein n=2 Tax=Eucalyptus grandis TaxID=71139 RepID=A0ACC3LCS2_EUCGR|nr:hypothetical protein EUGRSUZ_C01166 [Eucalyptus grandis]